MLNNKVLDIAKGRYPSDFDKLEQECVVSSVLLKFVLEEHMKEPSTQTPSTERVKAVKNLMTKYSFIVPMFDDVKEDEISVIEPLEYLVPSLLPPRNSGSPPPNHNMLYIYCYIEGSVTIRLFNRNRDIENKGFLPPGLFQRFVARILVEVDVTRGGNSYKFRNRDQVWFYIGQTKFTLTALKGQGIIVIEYEGDAIYGPVKLMQEIMVEVTTECFHQKSLRRKT